MQYSNKIICTGLCPGCHGQRKRSGKSNFFQVRESQGISFLSQGNLDKMKKKSWKGQGILKNVPKKVAGRQASGNFISINCKQYLKRNFSEHKLQAILEKECF